jgi:signal transduction histidine kinase
MTYAACQEIIRSQGRLNLRDNRLYPKCLPGKLIPMAKSPTARLLLGLLVTLAAVAIFSWYTLAQLGNLRRLQTETIDRNRRDTLQLLRMQNDLSQIGLALSDISQGSEPYGIAAYRNELADKRADLEDALQTEARLTPEVRTAGQQRQLENAIRLFRETTEQMFSMAQEGDEQAARQLAGTTLAAQQSAVSALVARLLFRNNEAEEQAAARVAAIYKGVGRNIYAFLAAMLVAIVTTSLGVIYYNRRMFDRMESLSQQRRVLAARLITVQEEVLRSVSRELHDEFGQILTAIGAMLGRAGRNGQALDPGLRDELSEVRQITQDTLEKMRSLSQMLHPAVLDDYGLVKGLDWYTQLFQKQTGIETTLDVSGDVQRITGQAAIHCFRIVQEALNNAAKHANTKTAEVALEFAPDRLMLTVRDFGIGIVQDRRNGKPGLGLIAMRERAELLRGSLDVEKAAGGGIVVTLRLPLPQDEGPAYLTGQEREHTVNAND